MVNKPQLKRPDPFRREKGEFPSQLLVQGNMLNLGTGLFGLFIDTFCSNGH